MNDQILIGILTEIKDLRTEMKTEMNDMKAEMKEMKLEMNDMKTEMREMKSEIKEINERVTNLEKSRKEDVRAITDIVYSFEQGIVKMINEEIDKRMYMQNIVK